MLAGQLTATRTHSRTPPLPPPPTRPRKCTRHAFRCPRADYDITPRASHMKYCSCFLCETEPSLLVSDKHITYTNGCAWCPINYLPPPPPTPTTTFKRLRVIKRALTNFDWYIIWSFATTPKWGLWGLIRNYQWTPIVCDSSFKRS